MAWKRYCRLLCVFFFNCCFVSTSISAAISDILFFLHETAGVSIKYIFPTSAWFLYLGEKAYFLWVKRLRGKGKKNGLMENCFAEYWGRKHGQNDRIEKSLCTAALRDRKRFVCLFVFFQNCGKDQNPSNRCSKNFNSRKTLNQKKALSWEICLVLYLYQSTNEWVNATGVFQIWRCKNDLKKRIMNIA